MTSQENSALPQPGVPKPSSGESDRYHSRGQCNHLERSTSYSEHLVWLCRGLEGSLYQIGWPPFVLVFEMRQLELSPDSTPREEGLSNNPQASPRADSRSRGGAQESSELGREDYCSRRAAFKIRH